MKIRLNKELDSGILATWGVLTPSEKWNKCKLLHGWLMKPCYDKISNKFGCYKFFYRFIAANTYTSSTTEGLGNEKRLVSDEHINCYEQQSSQRAVVSTLLQRTK